MHITHLYSTLYNYKRSICIFFHRYLHMSLYACILSTQ